MLVRFYCGISRINYPQGMYKCIMAAEVVYNPTICLCKIYVETFDAKWLRRVGRRLAQRSIASFHPYGQAYAETLLKDGSPPYDSYSLYRALALTTIDR